MNDDHQADDHDEAPSLRRRLHAATGDRDAEAHALADSAGDAVTERDAKIAAQRSRGERGADEPVVARDIATTEDAEGVAAQHRTGDAQARANGDDDPRPSGASVHRSGWSRRVADTAWTRPS